LLAVARERNARPRQALKWTKRCEVFGRVGVTPYPPFTHCPRNRIKPNVRRRALARAAAREDTFAQELAALLAVAVAKRDDRGALLLERSLKRGQHEVPPHPGATPRREHSDEARPDACHRQHHGRRRGARVIAGADHGPRRSSASLRRTSASSSGLPAGSGRRVFTSRRTDTPLTSRSWTFRGPRPTAGTGVSCAALVAARKGPPSSASCPVWAGLAVSVVRGADARALQTPISDADRVTR
jgi:hypothetical protein